MDGGKRNREENVLDQINGCLATAFVCADETTNVTLVAALKTPSGLSPRQHRRSRHFFSSAIYQDRQLSHTWNGCHGRFIVLLPAREHKRFPINYC